ncbi:Charged multivesicular body protein 7 [Chamberlinius hualienensis]
MAKKLKDDGRSYLPSCWSDDLRMDSMFSDFRSRIANPSDWDGKFCFWRNAIKDWCETTGRLTFTFAEARSAFSRNGRTPRGFKTVALKMISENNTMTLDAYLKMCSEQGWISWSWDILVRKPVSFAWSLVSSTFFKTQPETENLQYVNLDLIREKAANILEIHKQLVENGNEDNTIALKSLAKYCKGVCKSQKELELCCMWLRKENKLSLIRDKDSVIVKFFDSNVAKSTELSQMEKAVVQLRMVRKTLEHQIETFENEINKYKNEARDHLKSGSRTQAKIALQKKKQTENMMQKKEKTLENIEILLHRLQDASTQKSVLDALTAGSAAFKLDQGMDLDKVDETMAAVQETLEMQNEIQEAVAQAVAPPTDMSDLEDELKEILSSGEPEPNDNDDDLLERLNKLREDREVSGLPSPRKDSQIRKTTGKTVVYN